MKRLCLFALPVLLAGSLFAATSDSTRLTLDRIFSSREFAEQRSGSFRWIDEGDGYTSLEPARDSSGGMDILRYDTRTGERTVLVTASQLIPGDGKKPLRIENYVWSRGREYLLIFTSSRRVWRQKTRGDYWILRPADNRLRKLGGTAPPSTLMFAEFSPQGDRVAYVRENNLYVEDVATGTISSLTSDGSPTIINGTFDWVYEEEFDCRQGFRWSPDGSAIAYWQLDASNVGEFFLINNTDSIYSRPIPIQYPKVGTSLSSCRIGVVAAGGGRTIWMNLEGDPRNNYIPRLGWRPDGREIIFQYLNRLQNRLLLTGGDPATGNTRTLLVNADSAWVDVVDDMKWLRGGDSFVWVDESEGWRHLFVYGRDGEKLRSLTPERYDAIDVVRISDDDVFFIASPDDPGQRYLYTARLEGNPNIRRVTPTTSAGTHSYDVAPNGKWAFHTFSSFVSPPTTELVTLPGHTTVRMVRDNGRLKRKLASLQPTPGSFFRLDIGSGVLLDGWRILPSDFDSTKKYPVIFHVYGEPAAQTVLDRWGGTTMLWHRMLAQEGYVVVSVDNRGTPAPRGREWRKSVYRQIGILASSDQAAAAREISKWKFVDSTRFGVWGWSGGGSMTLNMILRYPELFRTGVSVAPVPDQRLYDAIYQERYMGLPEGNPEGYTRGSPVSFAGNLRGNLLIVHGTGDDNVHY